MARIVVARRHLRTADVQLTGAAGQSRSSMHLQAFSPSRGSLPITGRSFGWPARAPLLETCQQLGHPGVRESEKNRAVECHDSFFRAGGARNPRRPLNPRLPGVARMQKDCPFLPGMSSGPLGVRSRTDRPHGAAWQLSE